LLSGRKFLEKVTANWPAKVLSIGVAIVLFMFHRMSALEERFFSVPLRVETNGQMVPASAYPRMVRVTLRGEANSVFPILEEDIEAYLDLGRYRSEGVFKAPVQIRKKGTALAVDPLEVHVEPLEIAMAVEPKLARTIPVTPSFRGYLEPGYEMGAYALNPAQVEVSGPAGLVQKMTDLTTDFIELSGRKEDFSATVKIINRETLVGVRGSGTVDFSATIQQSIMLKTYERLPIVISGLRDGFIARPQVNFGSVRLQGSQNELETFVPEAFMLSLDCSDIRDDGMYMLPLVVSAPLNVAVIRYDPLEVPVEIIVGSSTGGAP
jgi:hypothetical protein